jgi:ATP-dependent RNA helicase DeaD
MDMTTDMTTSAANGVLIEPERSLPEITFDDLPAVIGEAAQSLGWTKPTPVQAKAIPYLLEGRDMIVQAHTGSGKTGAFLIPLILNVDPAKRFAQALVLVPTRELASQVYKEFEALSAGTEIRGVLVYGGVGYAQQLQGLREGAQVVIGTPGRVLDHIGRRSLNLDRLQTLVFDEADEMLSMGFYPAMMELRRYLPRERRSWMFSATIPYKVQELARLFLRTPEFLSLSAGNESVSTMEHRFYVVPAMDKDIMLMRLIEMEEPESAIVFCNTKSEVEFLAAALQNHGYNADQLSGDMDQKARERAMARIRRRETRFLVATDIAARGIDISDLSHVFQHDVPKDTEVYLHRAGRTARAGNTGVVISLAGDISEKAQLKKIGRKFGIDFVELPIPTQEEVEQRIAERVMVILEDRFRRKSSRALRDRIARFEPLVRAMAEGEQGSLLAMLLDDIYHNEFHAARMPEAEPEPAPAPQPRKSGGQSSGGQSSAAQSSDAQGEAAVGDGEKKKKKRRRRGKKSEGAGAEEGTSESSASDAGDAGGEE